VPGFSFISGRELCLVKLSAVVEASYKLSPRAAATLTRDQSPNPTLNLALELGNFEFPPTQFSAAVKVPHRGQFDSGELKSLCCLF
jgi:hypothetical protein